MRVLVTGASGFIGSYVVREALRRNHDVIAMRNKSALQSCGDLPKQPEEFQFELGSEDQLDLAHLEIDAVVHLAASLQGTHEHRRRTILGGGCQVVEASMRAKMHKFVCVSSISVLDYAALPEMTLIDETTPPISIGEQGSSYAALKAKQESIVEAVCADDANHLVILRPGIVYDEDTLNSAHAGLVTNKLAVLVSHDGSVPVIEAGSLASAIVDAVEMKGSGKDIYQILDDELPSQTRYLQELHKRGLLNGVTPRIPWRLFSAIAGICRLLFTMTGIKSKLPALFTQDGAAGRVKPFRFSNRKAREAFARKFNGGFC